MSNGLPQTHAYDLAYRHALTIDKSGDRLAFGTTTGNVYVTEDQGDTGKRSAIRCRRCMRSGLS